MTLPAGIEFVDRNVELYWLLKGVGSKIDLNWMSVADDRRDFPVGTEGSHTSQDEETCFIETKVRRDAPPARTYLLFLTGHLRSASYLSVPSERFSGQLYGANQLFSREVFVANSGEFRASGADSILRYSAARHQIDGSEWAVVSLMPQSRGKLTLQWIEPIGLESPAIPVVLDNGNTVSSLAFPRPAPGPRYVV
ncbi:MAG TPA: hypothetical protein VG936_11015 [Lacunisphaera sp.]|nr:hypothetical protein [Lacunisphaera sp.]